MKKRRGVMLIITVLSVIAAIIFWKLFIRGSDFSWATQQTVFWDSVAETCLIFWLFFAVVYGKFSKRIYRYIAIGLIVSVFTYLHAYLVVSIAVVVYAFMIYLTGHLLLRCIAQQAAIKARFHLEFVLGIAGIICLVSLLSAVRCGTPEMLRRIFPPVFLLEVFLSRKDIAQWMRRQKSELTAPAEEYTIGVSVLMAVILTAVTVQACRANLGFDYDSLWYGYRSEYALAPEGGIYDRNIMMACVYTYAKGIETLSLVFSGLSSYSYMSAINLLFAVLTFWAVFDLGKYYIKRQSFLVAVALISLTPSIMVLSLTAKSDASTIYMQVVGLLFAVCAISDKRSDYLIASLSVLLLSLGFKPTSIVFTTILVAIVVVFAFCLRIRPKFKELSLLLFPAAAVFCLYLRTILLTGYPITSLVPSLFKSLGYYPRYPYTFPSSRITSLKTLLTTNLFWERLIRLVKLFFYPNTGDIMTLEITWWGPLFSVTWIGVILSMVLFPVKTWKRIKENRVECFVAVSFLTVSAISGGCMMLLETPDGNYFMLMQVLTYVYAAMILCAAGRETAKGYAVPFILMGACNLLLCVTISAAWILGFTPIEKGNHGYYNHKVKYVEPMMERNGLLDMYQYLEKDKPKRLVVFSEKSLVAFALPAISETYSELSLWGSNVIEATDSFYDYMMYAKTDGIMVEDQYLLSYEHVHNLLTELAERGALEIEYTSGNYVLMRVSEADGQAKQDVLQYIYDIVNNTQ